jgi:LCP family protein required for cell wall assembly
MSDLTRPVPPRGTPKRAQSVSSDVAQRAASAQAPRRADEIQVVPDVTTRQRRARPVGFRPRTKQEKTVRGIVFSLVAIMSVLTILMGYVWWRSNNLFNRIDRQEFSDGTLRGSDGRAPADPFNILLVGSDSRAEGDPVEGESSGVGGQRSDVMLVVRVVPGAKKAAFLSLPRDLYVKIADTGGMQRLNTAFNRGPENLINTVTTDLGIPIDHYMQIDFTGFSSMIDTLGGVTVNFAYPAIDTFSGLDQPNPGCQRLDGEQALAFVRSRHYQYVQNGKFQNDPTGDIGRIQRQQYLLKQIAQAAINQGVSNPVKADALVSSVVDYVTIDDTLTKADILDLTRDLKDTGVENLVSFTLPTSNASVTLGGQKASVLKMQESGPAVIAAFNSFGAPEPTTTTTVAGAPTTATAVTAPATAGANAVNGATLVMLNGTTTSGLAAKAATVMTSAGATVTRTGNGASNRLSVTEIRYGTNDISRAQGAAAALGVNATLVSDPSVTSTDLVITLGRDYINKAKAAPAASSASAASTATTVAPSTAVPATTVTTLPGQAPDVAPKGLSLEPCN